MPEGFKNGSKDESSGLERKPSFETIALNPETSTRIKELALQLPEGVYRRSFQKRGDFLNACESITTELKSSNVGSTLENLKNGNIVVLTITGIPLDPSLPPAPVDGNASKDKKTFVSEGFASGVALSLGYPSLILAEKNEALVHQITPVPGKENTQSNEGAVPLKLHQDLAPNPEAPSIPYQKFMPDWLILTGVQKGSGDTPTFISSIDDALPKLKKVTLEILLQERFITDPPYSFGEVGDPSRLPRHSILTLRDGHYESAFDISSNVRPRDPGDAEAVEALIELHEVLLSGKQEVKIEPGTAVIFNNRRVVHGRGAVAKEEGSIGDKRWIQRMYIFNTDRVAKEALASGYPRIQMGGGLLRVTGLGAPDLPEEFRTMLDSEQ